MGANAQTSVPAFTSGQVLTAAQVTQINTGIPVFASSTERDAAFGGTGEKTLAEGQMAYLEDTNATQYYDGSSWAAVAGGKILQVVSASYSTTTTSSSTSYADTGLTVNITPTAATSTILVLVSQNGLFKNTGNAGNAIALRLLRDATTIATFANLAGWTDSNLRNTLGGASLNYLDSPATTSAITYKTQFANDVAAADVRVQYNDVMSTITVMEVSA